LGKKGKTAGYPLLLQVAKGSCTDQKKKQNHAQYQENLKKQSPIPGLIPPSHYGCRSPHHLIALLPYRLIA
jgi:hypothetical protein